MEDVAKLVNRIIVMKDGKIHFDKPTREAFSDVWIKSVGRCSHKLRNLWIS